MDDRTGAQIATGPGAFMQLGSAGTAKGDCVLKASSPRVRYQREYVTMVLCTLTPICYNSYPQSPREEHRQPLEPNSTSPQELESSLIIYIYFCLVNFKDLRQRKVMCQECRQGC